MNRRGKRLTIVVAAMGLAVLEILAIVHWNTVRDHVEVWSFQLTRRTTMVQPLVTEGDTWLGQSQLPYLALANCSGWPVIVDRAHLPDYTSSWTTTESLLESLRNSGWRVLEQRFPRKAFVVIRDEHVAQDSRTWR